MRNQQRKVTDDLHRQPGAQPSGNSRDFSLPGGDAAPLKVVEPGPLPDDAAAVSTAKEGDSDGRCPPEAPSQHAPGQLAHEKDAASGNGELSGEDRRALVELEQLAHMLQELHATMDTALDAVAGAQQTQQAYPAGGEAGDPPLEPETPPEPSPRTQPLWRAWASRISDRRDSIILPGAGAGVVLLGLLGWLWYASSVLPPEEIQSTNSGDILSLDQAPAAEGPMPQAPPDAASHTASNQSSKTDARAPVMTGVSEASGATDSNAAPADDRTATQRVHLSGEPLHGVAGEPISLGIRLPETTPGREPSVVVQGVRPPATLTAGMDMGADIWMVDADQAGAVALLTPATFSGGQFEMDIRLVSNDGNITQGQPLTVSVEPSTALAASAEPPMSENDLAAQQKSPADGLPPPAAPLTAGTPQMAAASETSTSGATIESPVPAFPSEGQAEQLVDEQPLMQEEEVAAAQPGATQPSLLGQPSSDAATSSQEAVAQESAGPQTGEAQAPLPAQAPPPANDTQELPEPTRTEPVTTYVNMRAEPSNDAAVVTVVPAGERVGIIECRLWCEVTYGDKRGWIFNRFVGQERSSERSTPAASPASQRASVALAATQSRSPARSAKERIEPGKPGSVTAHVNLRAKPSNTASVITVVPAGGQLDVIECGQWCLVTFASKRGWIHGSLIDQKDGSKRSTDNRSRSGVLKKLWPF